MRRRSYLSRWQPNYDEVSLKPLSPTKLAYLAGLLDGEGYFQVSTKTNSFGLGVSITDREAIDWLVENIGGRASFNLDWTAAKRPVHRWRLERHADLAFLLPKVRRYLVIKCRQADAMIVLVRHLQNYPEYEVPTRSVTRAERDRRRKKAERWRERGIELRLEVRNARYSATLK